MINLLAQPTAEKFGFGTYVVQADAGDLFFLGDTNTMMTPFDIKAPCRFYVQGPGYFYAPIGATIAQVPRCLFDGDGFFGDTAAHVKDGTDQVYKAPK